MTESELGACPPEMGGVSEERLALVMSTMGRMCFDFVGLLAARGSGGITLKNPLVLEYADDTRELRGLAPLHVPPGLVNVLAQQTLVEIPRENVAYVVILENAEDSPLFRMYQEFFSQKIQ